MPRMAIYEALGCRRSYNKRRGLVFYRLEEKAFVETEISVAFRQVSSVQLNRFLAARQRQGENQVIRAVREWVRGLG